MQPQSLVIGLSYLPDVLINLIIQNLKLPDIGSVPVLPSNPRILFSTMVSFPLNQNPVFPETLQDKEQRAQLSRKDIEALMNTCKEINLKARVFFIPKTFEEYFPNLLGCYHDETYLSAFEPNQPFYVAFQLDKNGVGKGAVAKLSNVSFTMNDIAEKFSSYKLVPSHTFDESRKLKVNSFRVDFFQDDKFVYSLTGQKGLSTTTLNAPHITMQQFQENYDKILANEVSLTSVVLPKLRPTMYRCGIPEELQIQEKDCCFDVVDELMDEYMTNYSCSLDEETKQSILNTISTACMQPPGMTDNELRDMMILQVLQHRQITQEGC
jgi:hypothetical protein